MGEASTSTTAEIYVNGTSGSDSNPGTEAQPLKTISKAAQIAVANHWNHISTTITIRPGTYREFVQVAGTDPNVGAPITFQASTIGTVIVSGSDIWAGWQPDSTNGNLYTHSWPFRWGTCAVPAGGPPSLQPIVLRREMIFVNGTLLRQVLSLEQMVEGSFYIDEAGKRAYIWPLAGTNVAASTIEVATRPEVFQSYRVPHLTVSGLVFEHANSCISSPQKSGVTIVDATDDLLEDSAIRWNNWTGLVLYETPTFTARRVVVDHNGELGIAADRMKNATIEDVEASYNNWRGGWGNFVTWETGGAKFLSVHSAVFRNYKAVANQGRGIWFDTDNTDITIENALLSDNLVGGIDLEANVGPFTIENSRICNNQREGVQNNDSQAVRLTGNLIYNNQRGQIMVYGGTAPRTGVNWETNEPFSASTGGWSISANTIVGISSKELVYETVLAANQGRNPFLTTLKSDENTWFNSQNQDAFNMGPGQNVSFQAWRQMTGQDLHSRFGGLQVDAAAACAAP